MLQVILLPAVSIAFAAGPIAGQNFGAKNSGRVKETFRKAALIGTAVMIATIILVQWWPQTFVGMFYADASTIAVAALFLQLMSSTLWRRVWCIHAQPCFRVWATRYLR